MHRLVAVFVLLATSLVATAADPLVTGLKSPTSVAVGGNSKVYIAVLGEPGQKGDGAVFVVENGKAVPFATGLDDPGAIVAFQQWLYVADGAKLLRIDPKGQVTPFGTFASPPNRLAGLAADPESGTVYAADVPGQAIYRISPKGKVDLVTSANSWPELSRPTGLALDGASHLLVTDMATGKLHRLRLADGSHEQVADGLVTPGAVTWDRHGQLFLVDAKNSGLVGIPRPGQKPVAVGTFPGLSGLCLDPTGKSLLVTNLAGGTVSAVKPTIPGFEVDDTPLAIETALAFPDVQWTGWQRETEKGLTIPLRPIVLTHAGDGTNRVFVATQHGVIHAFPNDQKATKTTVFLDIQDRVRYRDDQNEEGFLGLAFHPNYKTNGELYVFYTPKKAKTPHTNVVSRFKVRPDDPGKVDPSSEEEILRIEHPFWNHDGGTVVFGPDGYLYVALGDGGAANDPFNNGQNLKSLLGKMLRLDVSRKDPGKAYAIPRDNPFVGKADASPEIYAYGLRNVWRMAFDRKTGTCWVADVGQNLWEEINLLKAGGNYGWNLRESLHPFGPKGAGVRSDLIDPIWEYHHDTGKSVTGGVVYRGKLLPELDGAYLYADYVSGLVWAMRYDEKKQRVVANQPIKSKSIPVMSFGEDEKGEAYFMTYSPTGQGIYRFVKSAAEKGR